MKYSLIIPALLMMACEGTPTAIDNPHVTASTDRIEYAPGERISIVIQNDSRNDLTLFHCDFRVGMTVERRVDNEWIDEFRIHGPPCPAVMVTGTVVVGSGSTRSENVILSSAGEYRLRLEAGTTETNVGVYSIVTNTFVVVD